MQNQLAKVVLKPSVDQVVVVGSILLQATTLTLDAATSVFNVSEGGRVHVYSTTYTGTSGNGRVRVDYQTLNGYPHHTASAQTIQSLFPEIGYWGIVSP